MEQALSSTGAGHPFRATLPHLCAPFPVCTHHTAAPTPLLSVEDLLKEESGGIHPPPQLPPHQPEYHRGPKR